MELGPRPRQDGPAGVFFSRMLYTEWPMWYNKTHPTRTIIVEVSPQLTYSVVNYIYHALNMLLKMGQGCVFPR